MEIIKGTPQELLEYKANLEKNNTFLREISTAPAFAQAAQHLSTKKTMLRLESHWSNSKQEWIPMGEMDSVYIVNVIKKMCREKSNLVLLDNSEFKALIVNLADRLEE